MLLYGLYIYWQQRKTNFYKDQEETKSENCKFSVFPCKSGEFDVRLIDIIFVFSCDGITLQFKKEA